MSEHGATTALTTWWAGERLRLTALYPLRCDRLIVELDAALARDDIAATDERGVLAEMLGLRARAQAICGQTETAIRELHALLDPGDGRFGGADRAPLLAALANCLESLGQYADALDRLHEAHALYASSADLRGVASTRLSMGVMHSRCGDHAIGYGHYREALAGFERLGEWAGVVRTLNNMGLNERNLDRLEESLATFDRALRIAEEQALPTVAWTLSGNRARTLLAMRRLDAAERAFAQHARETLDGTWTQTGLDARFGLLEVAHARGERRSIVPSLQQLVVELKAARHLDMEVRARRLLAECLEDGEGDVATVLDAYKALRECERAWFDQRAGSRLRASTLMAELDAARREVEREHQLRDELARAHAALTIESAERGARAEALYRQAHEDALTGLPNRRDVAERLCAERRRGERFAQPLSIAMVDIDHFKAINDRHGHAAGDQVLVEVARRLQQALRSGDLVARFGGEEFVALLPDATHEQACALGERLRRAVAAAPVPIGRGACAVTVSVGVMTCAGDDTNDVVLARADARLYAAKTAGRNRVIGESGVPVGANAHDRVQA